MNKKEEFYTQIIKEAGIEKLKPTARDRIMDEILDHKFVQIKEKPITKTWLLLISSLLILSIALTKTPILNWLVENILHGSISTLYSIISLIILPPVIWFLLFSKKANKYLGYESSLLEKSQMKIGN